ncbi:hypothetical protein [Singulisphaera acidiphila]|uniref:Uncharacterized protein n=1 Tax=Singulisphaera acidiphila (strain ATCC BAA-1392 / DSM 18658 / VKM B-2454 / MOB10) TaxID=886293 RepID=L0DHY5_SINAD|nr:hypothetical protein [Singulisphaera acidiphila]AGA28460.1 hypothetical protein Sinac_4259 [Singulisphaera acidiphila DSM 18658]
MTDDEPSSPISRGPFFSNEGPDDGLVMLGKAPFLEVLDGARKVIGTAWPVGAIPSRKGMAQLWFLEVGQIGLPGVYVCRRKIFVRIMDTAEDSPD